MRKCFSFFPQQGLHIFLLLLASLLLCCTKKTEPLFTQIHSDKTAIHFENHLEETDSINVMNYEYLYNGGGIGAGDFNNDGLCDLYFTGNMVSNRLYLNQGDMQFKDVTEQAQVAGRTKWKTGVSVADVNGDGWLDIYVCYSGPVLMSELSNELFINQGCKPGGIPIFKEQAKAAGIDAYNTFSTQATFFDYDRDGDLDMLLLNHGVRFYSPFSNTKKLRASRHPQYGNRLYRNDVSSDSTSTLSFTEVTDAVGIIGNGINFGLSASVSDLNNDGWPDMYVTNDYEEQDFCYLNNQDGTFREISKQAFGHLSRFGMGSDIADCNNDLLPDVMVLDMLPEDNHRQKLLKGGDEYDKYHLLLDSGFHRQQMRNTLQLHRGVYNKEGVPLFSEIGQLAGISATDWSWSSLFADYDNDGFQDLFVTNGYLRDFTNMDFMKYTVGEARELERKTGKKTPLTELIGRMPSTKVSNYIFSNQGNLTFQDKTREWGVWMPDMSFGAAYTDLDNDGDLDLVVNNTNQPATIWRNNGNKQNNYLKIKLNGSRRNTAGIGARATIKVNGQTMMRELMPVRGFQSSVEPILHFGVGTSTKIEELQVLWPDGKTTLLKDINSNQTLFVNYKGAIELARETKTFTTENRFVDITATSGVDFIHQEETYNDFNDEQLLPYQLSKSGSCLATADVNGDGLADFFVSGGSDETSTLYVMTTHGKFKKHVSQPWQEERKNRSNRALFFDADQDGDSDLYIVSGNYKFPTGSPPLQDRLYLNDGKGIFSKAPTRALPIELSLGSCVASADYDRDGDLDLFVGGGALPASYPLSAFGGILRNDLDPKTKRPRFTVATAEVNVAVKNPGIVTDACWSDYNNDGWPDLLLVGEWMPIRLFENRQGKLHEVNDSALTQSNGMWRKIIAHDFDKDGDMDYVAGNAGTNLSWKATVREPLELFYSDFDDNGKLDPIICNYVQGISYPIATRDELLSQISPLRKIFVKYADYADARMEDIFSEPLLQKAKRLYINTLSTSYIENLGNGKFSIKALPTEAQFSMTNGLLANDFNLDGNTDLVLSGNFYPYRVQSGPSDAGMGLLLLGDGKGNFKTVPNSETNLCATGDVRDMVGLQTTEGQWMVFAKNNGAVQILKSTKDVHENSIRR